MEESLSKLIRTPMIRGTKAKMMDLDIYMDSMLNPHKLRIHYWRNPFRSVSDQLWQLSNLVQSVLKQEKNK